jgi:hypothetical protein
LLPAASGDRGAGASRTLRCAAIALLAIFVAAIADAIAMIRHLGVWPRIAAGRWLAALVVLFALVGIVGAGRIASDPAMNPTRRTGAWARAVAIAGAGALLLAIYPEAWRLGAPGAILTALFGMALLLAEVRGLALVLLSPVTDEYDDLLDDLAAAFGRAPLRASAGGFPRWLRTHHWRIVAGVALAGGLGLAAAEALGEGLPASARRALVVLGVFTAIEALGILLGYAFLGRPLALVRSAAVTGRPAS